MPTTRTLTEAAFYRRWNLLAASGAMLLYIVNQVILKDYFSGKAGIPMIGYFCRCYLNDLLYPLFFLGFCEILLIWIDREIRSFPGLVLLAMSAGLLFEFAGPLVRADAVSDPLDLVCYLTGTCVYYLGLRASVGRVSRQRRKSSKRDEGGVTPQTKECQKG